MRLSWMMIFIIGVTPLCAQTRGDIAVAERYAQWAEQAIAEDRWAEAHAALERAADFASVSSDISYLLALARSRAGGSRYAVLEAVERAITANRWLRYTESQARLLEAEQLAALRNYEGALAAVAASAPAAAPPFFPAFAKAAESADAAYLRLLALRGLAAAGASGGPVSAAAEFRRHILESLERHPRDPRFLRVLFDYERNRLPVAGDEALVELALRRLPFLLEADPDLSWMAAPCIRDRAEAGRLVAAYRSGSLRPVRNENFRPAPASIAPALELGLLSETEAAAELFAPVAPNAEPVVDKDLILAVSDLVQGDAARQYFAEQLLSFTGTITADDDHDGWPESRAVYRNGLLEAYFLDADQDGLADLTVSFEAGSPRRAEQWMPPEAPGQPLWSADRRMAQIHWERFPSALRAELDGAAYIPAPGGLQFAPIRFVELAGSENYAGLLYPEREPQAPRLSRRSLAAFAGTIERPSVEFAGAVETITLERGIPLRSTETLNGSPVSATEFEQGWPVLRRLDLDLDGRMETVRRFRQSDDAGTDPVPLPPDYNRWAASSESDWNGDGVFEYAELYLADGSVVYSWDMDGDGIREYSEMKTGKDNNEQQ